MGNEVMGMGENGYMKVIPAHLYYRPWNWPETGGSCRPAIECQTRL